MHDIAITPNYVLLPVVARTTSEERLRSGEPMWEWDGSKPTVVAVLPRNGGAKDIRWFKGPARNTLHFLNAVEHKDGIVFLHAVEDGPANRSYGLQVAKLAGVPGETALENHAGACRP